MINEGINKVKLRAGKYLQEAIIIRSGDKLTFKFRYNKKLIEEIKNLQGRKWDPKNKVWTAPYTLRNIFTLKYLMGKNPYILYDKNIEHIDNLSNRPIRKHQYDMINFWLTKCRAIIAADMGTGKSLTMIEGSEWVWNKYKEITNNLGLIPYDGIWYVGPKSALVSYKRELTKWDSQILPQTFTCEGLVKHVQNISRPGNKTIPPLVLLLDESSKYKTHTSQRSKAVAHIANAMAEYWPQHIGNEGYIIEATGTPAPKDPTDWWNQVEILCPGYLKEQTPGYLKQSLGIVETRESQYGAKYPHLVTWLDDSKKCGICGQYEDHQNHNINDIMMGVSCCHTFKPSVNEVNRLYNRLKDIVLVIKKEDCLELPEKQYELIKIKPTVEILRSASNIKASSRRAIEALTFLRELSDGFQYETINSDQLEKCEICNGKGDILEHSTNESREEDYKINTDIEYSLEKISCPDCLGVGKRAIKIRVSNEVKSPKDDVFINELEAHEEIGRYVVWGGFTGTIDRLVKIALNEGWSVLRVDGRGYNAFVAKDLPDADYSLLLDAMDSSNPAFKMLKAKYPKVCFVGHPRAGGMGLTLTGSPTALFYSNDFSGEARMQAEDRIHRMGMDENRGATIKDIIMLPTDKLVIDNLKKKKSLQAISMGDLNVK